MMTTSGKATTESSQAFNSILEEMLNSGAGRFGEEGKLVILVPKQPSLGNICMKNARQFFVNSKYEPVPENAISETNLFEFKHSINGRDVTFEVCDDIPLLKEQKKL